MIDDPSIESWFPPRHYYYGGHYAFPSLTTNTPGLNLHQALFSVHHLPSHRKTEIFLLIAGRVAHFFIMADQQPGNDKQPDALSDADKVRPPLHSFKAPSAEPRIKTLTQYSYRSVPRDWRSSVARPVLLPPPNPPQHLRRRRPPAPHSLRRLPNQFSRPLHRRNRRHCSPQSPNPSPPLASTSRRGLHLTPMLALRRRMRAKYRRPAPRRGRTKP